jgi:hypothetical protein
LDIDGDGKADTARELPHYNPGFERLTDRPTARPPARPHTCLLALSRSRSVSLTHNGLMIVEGFMYPLSLLTLCLSLSRLPSLQRPMKCSSSSARALMGSTGDASTCMSSSPIRHRYAPLQPSPCTPDPLLGCNVVVVAVVAVVAVVKEEEEEKASPHAVTLISKQTFS